MSVEFVDESVCCAHCVCVYLCACACACVWRSQSFLSSHGSVVALLVKLQQHIWPWWLFCGLVVACHGKAGRMTGAVSHNCVSMIWEWDKINCKCTRWLECPLDNRQRKLVFFASLSILGKVWLRYMRACLLTYWGLMMSFFIWELWLTKTTSFRIILVKIAGCYVYFLLSVFPARCHSCCENRALHVWSALMKMLCFSFVLWQGEIRATGFNEDANRLYPLLQANKVSWEALEFVNVVILCHVCCYFSCPVAKCRCTMCHAEDCGQPTNSFPPVRMTTRWCFLGRLKLKR